MDQPNPHNDQLEEFYEDPDLQKLLHSGGLEKLNKRMWKWVWGLLGLASCWFIVLAFLVGRAEVGYLIGFYVMAVILCFVGAALLAIILALVPISRYSMNDRMNFLIPLILIVLGVIGILLLALSSLAVFSI